MTASALTHSREVEFASANRVAYAAGYVRREFVNTTRLGIVRDGISHTLFELYAPDGSRRMFIVFGDSRVELLDDGIDTRSGAQSDWWLAYREAFHRASRRVRERENDD